MANRPVDIDLTQGVQAPPRDISEAAHHLRWRRAKPSPSTRSGAPHYTSPKSRRDLTGIWINQGGIGWTPGIPPGARPKPPLTPEYAKIFEQAHRERRRGQSHRRLHERARACRRACRES